MTKNRGDLVVKMRKFNSALTFVVILLAASVASAGQIAFKRVVFPNDNPSAEQTLMRYVVTTPVTEDQATVSEQLDTVRSIDFVAQDGFWDFMFEHFSEIGQHSMNVKLFNADDPDERPYYDAVNRAVVN